MGEEERTVAGWILERPLGTGGYGQVWRARRRHVDLIRALKLVPLSDERTFGDWRHEIERLETITHPNIVRFYDADIVADNGPYHGHAWIATELCDHSLADELDDAGLGRLDDAECEALVEQMLGALAVAHEDACVHRDVKPANILRHRSGAWKLCDFGTARLIPKGSDRAQTMVIGTSPYMSAAALRGRQDQAADLYALGVTVHEALTGEMLHRRELNMSDADHVKLILDTPPTLAPELSSRWRTVIEGLAAVDGINRSTTELYEWFRSGRGHTPLPRAADVLPPTALAVPPSQQAGGTGTRVAESAPGDRGPYPQVYVPAPEPPPSAPPAAPPGPQAPAPGPAAPAGPVAPPPQAGPSPEQQQREAWAAAERERWRPTEVTGRRITAFCVDAALVWFIVMLLSTVTLAVIFNVAYEKTPSDQVDNTSGFCQRQSTAANDDCRVFSGDGNIYVRDEPVWGIDQVTRAWTAVVVYIVFVTRQGRRGVTPGKRVTGIRVTGPDGRPPGLGRTLVRVALLPVDLVAWPILMANSQVDEGEAARALRARRRVGDRVANTWVVRSKPPSTGY